MVSVVIPAYNCEKYINKAVCSVFEQDFPDIELIVVNDGSTDNTLSKLTELQERFFDRRFSVITTANQGVSAARNVGISQVKGEYVAFLDADDWLDRNAISVLYRIVQEYPEKMISTNLSFINESEIEQEKDLVSSTKMISPKIMEKKESLCAVKDERFHLQTACSKLFSVSLLKEKGILFDEDISFGEDGLFVFRYLCEVDGVAFFDICVYNVLAREGSATRVSFNPKWLEMSSIDRMIDLANDDELICTLENLRARRLYSDIRRYFRDDVSAQFYPIVKRCLKANLKKMMRSSCSFKSKTVWVGMIFLPRGIISKIVRNND